MKYANADATVYLKQDSQAALDEGNAITLARGQEFEDDHPLVIERPELFSDAKEQE